VTGKDLFSAGTFNNPSTTSVFLTFIAELSAVCNRAQPTRTHHFIQKLDKTGKLLRSYTQNVDGFERRMGMESGGRGKGLSKVKSRNVELHGDLGRVRCVLCFKDFPASKEMVEFYMDGVMPDCPACEERSESTTCALQDSADITGTARVKRGSRAVTTGVLRPSIVLYDEPHPLGDAIGDLQGYDIKRGPDLLLIMGTSLKVHGLKQLVKDFAKRIHEHENPARRGIVVFVNQTKPGKEWEGIIDIHVQGETDKWVEGVEKVWRRNKPGDWEVQTTLDGQMQAQEVGPVSKPEKKKPSGKKGESKA
jgi:NAD-dependent histone deacetylase SIR2